MSGVTAKVRRIVRERDAFTCQRCARYIGPFEKEYSLQHRRNRGMGGSKRADTNQPANLVLLCGSATSPDGCHAFIEANPDIARAEGMRLFQSQTPSVEPVLTYRGWLLLDDEGQWEQVEAA